MPIPEAVAVLERDLRSIFGSRMQSLVVYGLGAHRHAERHPHGHPVGVVHDEALTQTLAVVDVLTADDLRACSSRVNAWHEAGIGTPLLLAAHEFERALDAFPFELGAILADHAIASGSDPFDGLSVDRQDLRRACEVQARSHLLHLREGYLESHGDANALAMLLVRSAPAFAALVTSVSRLDGRTDEPVAAARHVDSLLGTGETATEIVGLVGVHDLAAADADRLFSGYLALVERLVARVDQWQ